MAISVIPPKVKINRNKNKKRNYNWAISDLLIQKIWRRGIFGQGVRVAVLDSGLPTEGIRNRYFRNVITEHERFIDNDVHDKWGHGTHVAGIIASQNSKIGIAPLVELLVGKVLQKELGRNEITEDAVVAGIKWAIACKAQIINMSLSLSGYSAKVHEAIQEAVGQNILVLCSADPHINSTLAYPGQYNEAVAVVGLGKDRTSYYPIGSSGVAPQTELSAPGENILSHYHGGDEELEGTSMACAVATGLVALWYSSLSKIPSVQQTRRFLEKTAFDLFTPEYPNRDDFSGHGLIDPFLLKRNQV